MEDEDHAITWGIHHPIAPIALIDKHHCSKDYDIAVFGAAGLEGMESLPLAGSPMSTRDDVLTYEYSHTYPRAYPDGSVGAHFAPYTHKGNILRHYFDDYKAKRAVSVFDTSFPALQGASGAPVLRADDFAVVGMLISNHERDILPAQVVTVKYHRQRRWLHYR